MHEITRIHLARTPYNIEVGAKKNLEVYLNQIKATMQADDEDVYEIEARMVELLTERGVRGEKTITEADVGELKTQLGEPRDFASEAVQEEAVVTKTPRRLMRDTDNGWLGGVSAGLAAYFGIRPLWVRLLMIISPFVSFGTAAVIYILLWIVLPPARTAAEKLQMRGEPVTLDALKQVGGTMNENVGSLVQDAKKPLVMLMRIVLGTGFALLAVLSALALTIGVGASVFTWGVPSVLAQSPLLLVAGMVAGGAGLLFVVLMVLFSYMAFAWRSNKTLVVSAIVITVVGVLLAGLALGVGMYGTHVEGGFGGREQIEMLGSESA